MQVANTAIDVLAHQKMDAGEVFGRIVLTP